MGRSERERSKAPRHGCLAGLTETGRSQELPTSPIYFLTTLGPSQSIPHPILLFASANPSGHCRLRYEHMFDTVDHMHFEVDVVVQHPLDQQAERFLTSVQKSANRVLRFRGNDRKIIVTVEAHAYDREGAVSAAIREVAHIYPLVKFQPRGEPRPT
jgi:hypothetical protein